jgi:hypothetical protein
MKADSLRMFGGFAHAGSNLPSRGPAMDGLQKSGLEQAETPPVQQETELLGAPRFIIEWRLSPNLPTPGESVEEACCGCGGCGCLCNPGENGPAPVK